MCLQLTISPQRVFARLAIWQSRVESVERGIRGCNILNVMIVVLEQMVMQSIDGLLDESRVEVVQGCSDKAPQQMPDSLFQVGQPQEFMQIRDKFHY